MIALMIVGLLLFFFVAYLTGKSMLVGRQVRTRCGLFGAAVTAFVTSTKLNYVEPG